MRDSTGPPVARLLSFLMHNPHRALICLIAAAMLAIPATAQAQDNDRPTLRELDPWARFPKGSWRSLRTTTEFIDKNVPAANRRAATATTINKTAIERIDSDRVLLRVETSVDLQGKQVRTDLQTVEHRLLFPTAIEPMRQAAQSKVVIEGHDHFCDVYEVVTQANGRRTVTRQFISQLLCPYLLRREVETSDGDAPPAQRSTTEVVAVDLPYRLKGEFKTVSQEVTVDRTAQNIVTSVDLVACDVPGGIVSRLQKEENAKGELVRRTTIELVSYEIGADDDTQARRRHRLFGRDRTRGRTRG